MNLGKLAITLPAPFLSAAQCVDLARKAETEWGYRAIWLAWPWAVEPLFS